MTETTEAVEALRTAVAAAQDERDEAVHRALAARAFADGQIVNVPGGLIDHVIVTLADSSPMHELEEAFGPARALPRRPAPSAPRQVFFEATLPSEGSTGATLLAEVGQDGRVGRLTVRRDEL